MEILFLFFQQDQDLLFRSSEAIDRSLHIRCKGTYGICQFTHLAFNNHFQNFGIFRKAAGAVL